MELQGMLGNVVHYLVEEASPLSAVPFSIVKVSG